nr:acetylxylan esterase [Cohnella sp. REN36]
MCIGLVDTITPPSTFFAAYNRLTCDKEIAVSRNYGREGFPGSIVPRLQLFMDVLQNEAAV